MFAPEHPSADVEVFARRDSRAMRRHDTGTHPARARRFLAGLIELDVHVHAGAALCIGFPDCSQLECTHVPLTVAGVGNDGGNASVLK